MPGLLIVALAGSLLIHGAALFGSDLEWLGEAQEMPVLQAELRPLPVPAKIAPALPPPPLVARPAAKAKPQPRPAPPPVLAPDDVPQEVAEVVPEVVPNTVTATESALPEPPPEPVKPVLSANGLIRFAIIKNSLGLQVGEAEHRWEFAGDGAYRLTATSETSGLAALLRPVRLIQESRGRLVTGGLQPDSFRSQRQGKAEEGADFDWSAGSLRLLRDGRAFPLPRGAQDMLSLNYQLAFLGRLAEGVTLSVATARKFERHALDSLGEEEIEVPAGRFRTLHLRALSESTTEIWIALDHRYLPVKIRFTDKKGESFEQVATELGN
jgi:hypothetical protein